MTSAVQQIERLSLVLAIGATLLSLLTWDARFVLGVALGGALATVNFHALRRILEALILGQGNRRRQGAMAVLLTLKFGLLALSLYLVIRFVPVSAIALLLGISTVVISIFLVGFRTVLRGAEP